VRCPDCYSCGVMESSTVLFHFERVILVFRDNIYIINILIHEIWLSVNTFGPYV
jgi:hypothetical protein